MKRRRLRRIIATMITSIVITYTMTGVSSITQVHAEENSACMRKVINANGTSVTPDAANRIKSFISEIDKTKGFVVYANQLDRTNHIEVNISVNDVTAEGVNIVLQNVREKNVTDYSYIGASNVGIQISDSSNIIVGAKIMVEKPNNNQTILNGGYSNNIFVTQLTEEQEQEARAN